MSNPDIKDTDQYETRASPARYDQSVQDTPTFLHRKSDISVISLHGVRMKRKRVNTDSSQSRIKETTDFDASFRFIHRIRVLYFKDAHRLTITQTHQPTDQNNTGMKRSVAQWQIFPTKWDDTFPPDSGFQTAPTRQR
jgi:hypothetical protein